MIVLLLSASLVSAQDRAAEVTAQALSALEVQDADAAERFRRADAAREAGDLATAGRRYAEVLEAVPDFAPALRRHCLVLHESGQRDPALERCRRALELSDAPENKVGLAFVLLDVPSGAAATPGDRAEAGELLLAALAQDPDDPVNARLRCHLAMEEGRQDLLQDCVADMQRLAPDQVMSWWYAWQLAFQQQRWDDALAALDQAEAAGMPAADVASFRQLTVAERPWWRSWGPALGVGALLGGLFLVVGRMLLPRRLRGPGSQPG